MYYHKLSSQFRVCIIVLSPTHRFYLYKLPYHKSRIEGLKYLLLEKGSEGWVDGTGPVNQSTGALARTMGPLYEVLYGRMLLLQYFRLRHWGSHAFLYTVALGCVVCV